LLFGQGHSGIAEPVSIKSVLIVTKLASENFVIGSGAVALSFFRASGLDLSGVSPLPLESLKSSS
jgi:hypothetical protein